MKMYDTEINQIIEVWKKCKENKYVTKNEIEKAIQTFYDCNKQSVDFKWKFDNRTSMAFHRSVVIDLEDYLSRL